MNCWKDFSDKERQVAVEVLGWLQDLELVPFVVVDWVGVHG